MWIIKLILFIGLLAFILTIGLFLILDKEDPIDVVKCPKCGYEFKYDHFKIIKYKYEGELKHVQECPRCKEYVEVK